MKTLRHRIVKQRGECRNGGRISSSYLSCTRHLHLLPKADTRASRMLSCSALHSRSITGGLVCLGWLLNIKVNDGTTYTKQERG